MYLAYLDEADHAQVNSFTVCGLTAIPFGNIKDISESVEKIRRESGVYQNEDLLKSTTNGRPEACTADTHREIKNSVMQEAANHGAVFFAYCKYNEQHESHDATRNRVFGFNTLLGKLNDFLGENDSQGIVKVDRLDFNHDEFGNGYEYLRQKFQQGNYYKPDDNWSSLDRIVSFGMSCEGTSHMQSVNDILTGGFRYLVNGANDAARRSIQDNLAKVLWRDENGKFKERGFTMRPWKKHKLSDEVKIEYDQLRGFLNEKTG